MDRMEITRRALYDLVWSDPMTAVSKRMGVETYQLRKACIENKIPIPRCGHLVKLQFGKKVDLIPLPENQLEEKGIVFDFSDKKGRQFIDLLPLLKVPSRLVSPDKLIIEAKGIFEKKRKHWYAREWITAHFDGLDISVTPKNVDRALRLMDTIIKILYLRNHDITIYHRCSYAVVIKMEIKICLKELRKREKVKGTIHNGHAFHTTGLIYFKMGSFQIKQFTDGDQLLEKQIPAIMARLEIESLRMINERKKLERIWAIRDEKEKKEKEIIERAKEEKRDFRNLLNASACWHEARSLRRYINEVELDAISKNKLTAELIEWIAWAREKADWYDPITDNKDEVLDEADKGKYALIS